MTTATKVCVTTCGKCGMEQYGFQPHKGECPRCGRTTRAERWIAKPAPETSERARRENPAE